jgi:N utilization substance protein A
MTETNVFEAVHQLVSDKGISREKIIEVIQQALLSAYRKKYGSNSNVEAYFDKESETIKIFVNKYVVEKLENEQSQITITEARKIKKDAELGEEIPIEEDLSKFGRIAAQTARQVVIQRLKELEKDMIYKEYKNKEGDLINGYFQRMHRNSVFVDLGKTEGILPGSERQYREKYRPGQRVKALILEVRNSNKGPQVILSRNHTNFVRKLFELEIPEIYDGIVEIVNIVREPGYRTKVAVSSTREDIDPVGACVGMKGMRIQAIVREIDNEKIDIVEFSENPIHFITKAMQPATLKEVVIIDKNNAIAVVADEHIYLAIGKNGSNAKLASRLTGIEISVQNEEEYAKHLEERKEESRRRAEELFKQPAASEDEDEMTPLEELDGLSPRLIEILKAANIKSVDDLLEKTLDDLTAINGIGAKTAEQIQSILAENVVVEEEE